MIRRTNPRRVRLTERDDKSVRIVREDAPPVLVNAVKRTHTHASQQKAKEDNAFLDALGTSGIVELSELTSRLGFDAVPVGHRLAAQHHVAILPGLRVVATPPLPEKDGNYIRRRARLAFEKTSSVPMLKVIVHLIEAPFQIEHIEATCGPWTGQAGLELWGLGHLSIDDSGLVTWSGDRSPGEILESRWGKQ